MYPGLPDGRKVDGPWAGGARTAASRRRTALLLEKRTRAGLGVDAQLRRLVQSRRVSKALNVRPRGRSRSGTAMRVLPPCAAKGGGMRKVTVHDDNAGAIGATRDIERTRGARREGRREQPEGVRGIFSGRVPHGLCAIRHRGVVAGGPLSQAAPPRVLGSADSSFERVVGKWPSKWTIARAEESLPSSIARPSSMQSSAPLLQGGYGLWRRKAKIQRHCGGRYEKRMVMEYVHHHIHESLA